MGLFGNKGGWFGKKFDQFTGDVGQLFSDPKAWSQQHRNAILGTIIAPGIGTLIGSGVDDRGGVSEMLFGKKGSGAGITPDPLPSRNDVVMGILNQQLETMKRRKQGSQLGTNSQSQDTSALASSTLFGV